MRNFVRRWLGLPYQSPGKTSPSHNVLDDVINHGSRAAYEAFLIDNGFVLRIRSADMNSYDARPAIMFCKDVADLSDALIRHATQHQLGIRNPQVGVADATQYTLPLKPKY